MSALNACRISFLAVSISALAVPASAQQRPSGELTTERSAPVQLAAEGEDVRLDIIAGIGGISRNAAREQAELSDKFQDHITALVKLFPENYIGSIIEYGPRVSFTIVYDRAVSLPQVQQAVPSELRPYLKIKRSRLTRSEIAAGQKSLVAQLSEQLGNVSVAYDKKTDRFKIYVADDVDMSNVKPLVDPKMRPFVEVMRGASRSLAVSAIGNADQPTHSDKGSIWGGWPITFGSSSCTGGFIGKGLNGWLILTAGHCANSNVRVPWSDNTFKTMQDAFYQSIGNGYDVQSHWGAFLTSAGYFWVDRDVSGTYRSNCEVNGTGCQNGTFRNVYGGVSSNGYIAVTDAFKGDVYSQFGWNFSHPEGAVRCKYGMMTGVTCGTIEDSEFDSVYTSDEGLDYALDSIVRVKINSTWPAAVAKGDSGGPVFSLTGSSGTFPTAIAAGLSSTGSVRRDGTLRGWRPCIPSRDGACYLDYMPIHRINDNSPVTLAGSNGDIDVD